MAMLGARLTHASVIRLGIGLLVLGALAGTWLWPAPLPAQAAAAPAPAAAAQPGTAPAATAAGKKGPPAPEEISLPTRDGVELGATFFPGTKGKETVPVILVPGFKGSQNDYQRLAANLQKQGHAVLAVDLRGHGASKKLKASEKPLEPDTMSADQYYRMVDTDMERFKKFLMEKHNAGELNIELLCVVGADMGAIVALEWARIDWSWPVLATGKQGQDVRALVLISPVFAAKHLKLGQVLSFRPVMENLSILILVGEQDAKGLREAKRLNNSFKKYHPDVPQDQQLERKNLFFYPLKTSLSGSKLIAAKGLNTDKLIEEFIKYRLVNKAKDYPWKQR